METRGGRGRARRGWWAAAGAAVIVVGALAGVSLVGAGDQSSSAIAERASRLAAVNGDEQVGHDDGVVSTPCFSFTQPDIGTPWMLVAGTRGCAVALMPRGGDMLTEFHVRGRTGSGTVEDVLNDAVVRARDAGEPVERAEVVVIAGRDVGVMFQTTRDGLRVATYLVPIPAVASHDGAPVAVVDIGALISPWHDDVVTRIIGSLPGAREAPDVGGGS